MSLLATRGQLPSFRSVFDVAHHYDKLKAADAALPRIYSLTSSRARCLVGRDLGSKYGLEQDNQQLVVSVTNRHTLEQTWFNEARTKKPQTFSQDPTAFLDGTGGGERCDFCRWEQLTAQDAGFGRVALQHAVTGSNLFKYAEPGHGIVLFRHHDPLTFDFDQLSDLVNASWLWFLQSAQHQYHQQQQQGFDQVPGSVGGRQQLHPFLLWNCLPRAGASQYHGHAQVMLTGVPVPHQQRLWQAAAAYPRTGHFTGSMTSNGNSSSGSSSSGCTAAESGTGPSVVREQEQQQVGKVQQGLAATSCPTSYYQDLLLAHAEVGLLRQLTLTAPAAASSNPQQQQLQQQESGAKGSASSSASSSMQGWQQATDVPMSDAAAAAEDGSSTPSASSSSTGLLGVLGRGRGGASSGSMATSGSSSSMAMSNDGVLPLPAPAAADAGMQDATDTVQQQQQQQQQQGQAEEQVEQHVAWVMASLCPLKDMEVMVVGSHLTCPAFQHLLHTGLRTLVDDLGCRTFNVGVLNVDIDAPPHPAVQRCLEQQAQEAGCSSAQQQTSSAASSGGGDAGTSRGADCSSSSSRRRVGSHWRAEVSQPVADLHLSTTTGAPPSGLDQEGAAGCARPAWLQQGPLAPVIARVVSRGKLTSAASDFGGLEVFGGASIGHTDPFKVVAALEQRLQGLLDGPV